MFPDHTSSPVPSVSVIIPVYRAEAYFERCLRSLFGQTLPSLEYLFVDDASPDGSIALLEKVLAEYPLRRGQVRLIRHEHNRGSGPSREEGMRAVTGEYVIHCDADDWVEPGAYEAMYAVACEQQADMVCCEVCVEYPGRREFMRFPTPYDDKQALREYHAEVLYNALWNRLVRRSLYQGHGVYPYEGVNMWEDVGVVNRLRYFSRRTVVLREAFCHYNRCNVFSMRTYASNRAVDETLRVVDLLDGFFRSRPDGADYTRMMEGWKLAAKRDILLSPTIRDPRRWRATFPEANAALWRVPGIPLNIRLMYWFALHGMPWMIWFLLKIKPFLIKLAGRGYKYIGGGQG